MNLKELAKELYFRTVLGESYRKSFVEQLEVREVIDKRNLGFRCSNCGKFQNSPIAFAETDSVIYPRGTDKEFWIVNTHYDGCRGWD